MTSPRRWDPALILLIAMLATLPVLAWLQYSWIGEVERADADRMRASLQRSADQLASDVDSELGRFYRRVMNSPPIDGQPPEGLCQAFVHWRAAAPQPRLILGISIWQGDAGSAQCDPNTGESRPAAFPQAFRPLTEELPGGPGAGPPALRFDALPPFMLAPYRRHPPHPGGERFRRGPMGWGGPAAEGRTGPPRRPGFAVADLDLEWMRTQWLPDLVRRYFGSTGPGDSEPSEAMVRVETTAKHARVFESGPWGGGPADATTQLLRLPGAFRVIDAAGPPAGYWTLLVRRKEGTVAEVAARVRNRNVAVSGGVLAFLAAALAVLLVTLRRQRRLAQQQMEFVAGVSHELRTPVTVLSSAGENLADGIVTAPASVREYGAMIRDESRRLAGMIEQTLRFAGIQSGGARYKLQRVDVARCIDTALRNADALIRESGCSVELDVAAALPAAHADASALVHCIGNLLSNAARYGNSGKSIIVRARASGGGAGGSGYVNIEVEDLGPGIDPRDVPHLFEPFYRGRDIRDRQIQGTGLGLALVKSIMDGLDGRVEVRTAKGQGSQFRLILPVAPPAVPA